MCVCVEWRVVGVVESYKNSVQVLYWIYHKHLLGLNFSPWTPPPPHPASTNHLPFCRCVRGGTLMSTISLWKFISLYGPLFSTVFFRYNMVRRDQVPEFKHRIRQIKIAHKSMATVWQIFVNFFFYFKTILKSLTLYICAKPVLKHLL